MLGRFKRVVGRRSKEEAPAAAPTTSNVARNASAERDLANSRDNICSASDYWQVAYNRLSEAERNTLSTVLPETPSQPRNSHSRTKEILNRVLEATEKQYEGHQESRTTIRAAAHKILDSAFAWAIVSLGLVMAKNHADLRDALFDSSAYLADVLTRCAFIEEQLYRESDAAMPNAEKGRSIVRVYAAILRYAAEVRRIQRLNTAGDVMESIAAITSQPLIQLKSSINEEELHLQLWLLLDQHLHRKAEAEAMLVHIDASTVAIEEVGKAVAMLNLPFADGACFDSFMDQHEDECLPGTRTELLQQVKHWGSSEDKCIFWLSGMAGTGKSTIARTVARLFKEDGVLGASFFFRRGEGDRGSAARFFPTVVKQIATHIPQTIPGIQKAIEDDPAISAKSLREQFDKLLLQPLLAMDRPQAATPTVIVIDALDECEREEDVELILELLPKVPKVIRFFVTARPDPAIRFGFDQFDESDYQNTILQEMDDDVIKHDITLYLREEFSKLGQKRRRVLPQGWPGEERIQALATMAAPLFIFAATVCRFVADRKFNPEKRLQQFLAEPSGSKMDKTYRPVLNQLFTHDRSDMAQLVEEFQKIVGVVILLAAPLSLSALAQLLKIPEEDISNRLDSFHSVLSIPDDPHLPIRALHLSFHDYLVDERTRAHEATSLFWIDEKEKHGLIASHCLTLMNGSLGKNICKLPSYGTVRDEIDPASIPIFLPDSLRYACRYWAYHLTQSPASARNLEQILAFLEKHFLHWLESMSILGVISEALITATPNDALFLFLLDAKRFILKNAHIAERAPLQLYCSGLIFAPQQALIRTMFKDDIPDWISRLPKTEENWSAELQTLEGHSSGVNCIKFSPGGRTIASASDDGTIKLWGTAAHSLKGHGESVNSVAISPDSNLVASGSADYTVKLWKVWQLNTGTLQSTLKGHSKSVNCVVFSPDAKVIASGSGDGTVKIWDATIVNSGCSQVAHTDAVREVAFSPNGKQVASYSLDDTIRLWDITILNATTGATQSVIRGHSDLARTVRCSPDGRFVASTSADRTTKLWQTATGDLEHCLQNSRFVNAMAFAPDTATLASSARDGTIKLWDTASGTLQYTLPGAEGVEDLSFSEDGKYLKTNLGSIDIEASKAKGACVLHRAVVSVEDGEWVYFKGEKVLWLPHEHRGVIAVRDGRVVIGNETGKLTYMDFGYSPVKARCVPSADSFL
ncbi:hypothetical protein BDV10DRAFT_202893 [Aspergillus recurvatus]